MTEQFVYKNRVRFSETDTAGIVHFANYLRFMENAEHAFIRSLGFTLHSRENSYGFPRVNVSCNYKAPLFFEDEYEVIVKVAKLGTKSVTYAFTILRIPFSKTESVEKHVIAEGNITAVYVSLNKAEGKMQSSPIPLDMANALKKYV